MRDQHPTDAPPPGEDEKKTSEDLSPSHLKPLAPRHLVAAVLVGAILGWAARDLADSVDDASPVSWIQIVGLWFMAALLAAVAFQTRRAVRSRGATLDPERMVNRLVLARAAALVGAVLAGGYAGYAMTWLDSHPDLVVERVGLSALAALGGVAVVISAKFLEWACRVPKSDPHP